MILSPNYVVFKDIETGRTISRNATANFSNERLIIADFKIADKFLREVLYELYNEKNLIFRKSIKIVLQIKDLRKPIASSVEVRIYRDMIEHIGASRFIL